jgi:hypothetical protein
MIRLFFTLLFVLFAFSAFPQDSLVADVDMLHAELKKTHSYRDQIKGTKRASYDALVGQVKKELAESRPGFNRFYLLSKLLLPISDNHLYFYEAYETYFTNKLLSDTALVKKYRSSHAFLTYPRIKVNLDSLEMQLKSKPRDSIEGVYQHFGILTVGVFRTQKRDSLIGVVLESKIPIWERGEMYSVMKEYAPSRFYVWRSQATTKTFGLLKAEKLLNGRLSKSLLVKQPPAPTWYDVNAGVPVYDFRRLSSSAAYLRLGSFAGHTSQLREKANAFSESIKDSLSGSLVIVDLRNNGGGSGRSSGPFVKLLKSFKGRIAVLVNNSTVSEAEQVAIELSKLKNVRTFGEPTYAQITYGSNYGKRITLPSSKYILYTTDLPDENNYLPFEDEGLQPQVLLKNDRDWVKQVMDILN